MIFLPIGMPKVDAMEQTAGGCMGSDERKALKRAKAAERAFRASKGYAPDTIWNRLKAKRGKNS